MTSISADNPAVKMVYVVIIKHDARHIVRVVLAKRFILKSSIKEIAANIYGVPVSSIFVL